MLTSTNINRSIARIGIDLHRQIERKKHAGDFYALRELEFQAQYDFSGAIDTLPSETDITIPFTTTFVGDPGNQRDSTQDRPHARLTPELLIAPAGTVPYAYVLSWKYDDDFNYVGAIVRVGVHSPAMTAGQTPASTTVQGILHAAFQGYGALWDPDGPFDAGG